MDESFKLRIFSAPDGLCAGHCLAALVKTFDAPRKAYDALLELCDDKKRGSMNFNELEKLCKLLGVVCLTTT